MNLLSDDSLKHAFADQQKKTVRQVGWSVAAAVIVCALSFVGVKAYGLVVVQHERALSVDLGQTDRDIANLESRADALSRFASKLEILQKLFEGHTYWSQFIAALENYTLPSVSYAGLSAAVSSPVSLSATAPDFHTLGRQLLIFQKDATPLMSSVKITSGNARLNQQGDVSDVAFDVSFTINPAILQKKQ